MEKSLPLPNQNATLAEFAALTGLTSRWVYELVSQGILERNGRGRLRLGENVSALVAHYRTAFQGEINERERLTRAQADRQELRLEQDRGRLIDVEQAKRVYVTEAVKLKGRLLPIGRRLAQRLAMESDPTKVEEAIDGEAFDALRTVSEGKSPVAG